MKSAFALAALLGAVLTGCASQTGTLAHDPATHSHESQAASAVPDRMDERLAIGRNEARVDGLSCPLCAESLNAVVKRVDGVRSVWLDLDRGVVLMDIENPAPTRGQVAKAIDDAGFTFISFLESAGG
ncbi:MAG: heavy-metal-associated domain-containing protein [Phycisphaerales bacterium]|nr:heavy-metal-associated domain-containing protein [Phycisphaerales bacterium]MCB9836132.1 heavy-metal-associated domain-containing protein [Phycisphaera sp.]